MSNLIKGIKVRVEIGYTEGAAVAITSVTRANPGIVTRTAHGLAAGSVAYFNGLVGMPQLDGQPIRIDLNGSPSVNEFLTEGVDTTDFDIFTSGTLIPITAWQTLEQATTYQIGGGAAKTEDVSTLLDSIEKLESMKLAAETVTIDLLSYTVDNTALAKIRSVAKAAKKMVFRITLHDGAQRVFRGSPSIPGESASQGSVGKGQLNVTIQGGVAYLISLTP